jgi:hypothetical protein
MADEDPQLDKWCRHGLMAVALLHWVIALLMWNRAGHVLHAVVPTFSNLG